ncbi:hypothetical protein EV426DRAFT_706624 [Tirmania nivea]|nr:hypothetical protein EV426DRAFT_706624 [Tirmania nivea]
MARQRIPQSNGLTTSWRRPDSTPPKVGQSDFGRSNKNSQLVKTLGITVDSHLQFTPHIKARTHKAASLMAVMERLTNSNGGMSGKACRAMYTGIITASPLQDSKKDHLAVCRAARAVRTVDANVGEELEVTTIGKSKWYDEELSFGNRDDYCQATVTHLEIIPANSDRSYNKKEWYVELSKLADEGYSIVFTDRTRGKNEEVGAAVVAHNTKQGAA